MDRKQTDVKQAIKKSVNYLKDYFRIREVVLFGSHFTGKTNEFSDIDLAVISPDFKNKNYEEILNVFAQLALECGSNIELHPFADEDLKNARPTNFLGFILKNGKVVFRKNKFEI